MPEPWQGLLDNAAQVSAKTMTEMLAGRLQILKHREEAGEEIDHEAEEGAYFKLKDFMDLNNKFKGELQKWGLGKLRAAAVRLNEDTLRVKAITPEGSVMFDEPEEGFPNEELMTKLRLIA